jgi:hypothetical protein
LLAPVGRADVAFGIADLDLAAADLPAVLAGADFTAALFAADFVGAAFAADLVAAGFAAGFAVAVLAAVLAVDFVAGFDAAGFEVLAAVGFAIVLFAAAEAGLAAAVACFAGAALGGFVAPVFVGVARLDDASAAFAFGAAVLFVVLANCASLMFPSPDFVVCSRSLAAVSPAAHLPQIEPKTIVPTMYCDKAAARKPCLRVSFGMIFSCRAACEQPRPK